MYTENDGIEDQDLYEDDGCDAGEECSEDQNDEETCKLCGEEVEDCLCDHYDWNNIEFNIGRNGTTVSLQILNQEESLRNYKSLKFFNSLSIIGDNYPQLEKHRICIRGKMTFNDDHIATLDLPSEDDADDYMSVVVAALEEWDESLGDEPKLEPVAEKPVVQPQLDRQSLMEKISLAANKTKMAKRDEKVTKAPNGAITFSYGG